MMADDTLTRLAALLEGLAGKQAMADDAWRAEWAEIQAELDQPDPIQHAVAHWFTQGGTQSFGELGPVENADGLIAEILRVVRRAWGHQASCSTWDCKRCGESRGHIIHDTLAAPADVQRPGRLVHPFELRVCDCGFQAAGLVLTHAAEKGLALLKSIAADHDGLDTNDDHAWRKCRRCLAVATLDEKPARAELQALLTALAKVQWE